MSIGNGASPDVTSQAGYEVRIRMANVEIVTYIHQQELQCVCNIMSTVENA